MRLLQLIYINLILIPYFVLFKNKDYVAIKWLYIFPRSPLRRWKFILVDEFGETFYENEY